MTFTEVPLSDPNVTDVLPVTKLVPATVTVVPPTAAPDSGASAVTVGAPAASARRGVGGYTNMPATTTVRAKRKRTTRRRGPPAKIGTSATERCRSICSLRLTGYPFAGVSMSADTSSDGASTTVYIPSSLAYSDDDSSGPENGRAGAFALLPANTSPDHPDDAEC